MEKTEFEIREFVLAESRHPIALQMYKCNNCQWRGQVGGSIETESCDVCPECKSEDLLLYDEDEDRMKDITTTPTAELLAEYNLLNQPFPHLMTSIRATNPKKAIIERDCILAAISAELDRRCSEAKKAIIERDCILAAISAELDRRCSEAGLSIVGGFPTFTHVTSVPAGARLTSITVDISPADLRDLLTWLLMKGGNG